MMTTKPYEVECTPAISMAFRRLAAAVSLPQDPETLIFEILELVATAVDAGAVVLLRIEDREDAAARVDRCYDRAGIGVRPGDLLRLHDSYAASTAGREEPARTDDACVDSGYFELASACASATGTYTGVPLYRPNGRRFGTVCILQASARHTLAGGTTLLGLAGRIIADTAGPDAMSRAPHPVRRRIARTGTAGRRAQYEDVTAREQANDALRASEGQLRLLMEKTRDLIGLHDIDGRYVYLSPSCRDLLEPDELIGTDPYALFHPDDRARSRAESHDPARSGHRTQPIVYRIRWKSGAYTWFETLTQPLCDEGGHVVSLITSSRDVSDRMLALEALCQSEERFRSTVEQAAVGIAHVGLDGRCLLVNQRICDIAGYTRAQLLDRSFQGVDDDDAVPAYGHRMLDIDQVNGQRLLREEIETFTQEKYYVRKDQTAVWLDATLSLARAGRRANVFHLGSPRCDAAQIGEGSVARHAHDRTRAHRPGHA